MIHDNGKKALRDRAKIVAKYDELCRVFHLRKLPPEKLARLSNEQFYRLCEDSYNAQPMRAKRRYAETIGATERRNPLAFRWFVSDLIMCYHATGLLAILLVLSSPFRYPGFLKRKRARIAAEKAEAEKQRLNEKSNKSEEIVPAPILNKKE